jgi:hypothetical protein
LKIRLGIQSVKNHKLSVIQEIDSAVRSWEVSINVPRDKYAEIELHVVKMYKTDISHKEEKKISMYE